MDAHRMSSFSSKTDIGVDVIGKLGWMLQANWVGCYRQIGVDVIGELGWMLQANWGGCCKQIGVDGTGKLLWMLTPTACRPRHVRNLSSRGRWRCRRPPGTPLRSTPGVDGAAARSAAARGRPLR
eukprot:1178326-Prorocentrum_minimum.AAC.2